MKNLLSFAFLSTVLVTVFSLNLHAQEYTYKNLLEEPAVFTLKHGFVYHCSDKEAVPFTLPEAAVGFFYEFTVLPTKEEMNEEPELLSKLSSAKNGTPLKDIPFTLESNGSAKVVNTYIIADWQNIHKFEHCEYQKYPLGGDTKVDSQISYFENPGEENLFIGFECPYGRSSKMQLKVEVVAVFEHSAN
ncbi:MAG: hypothetical protein AAFZ15_01455 [Bacteroidota bacterium]